MRSPLHVVRRTNEVDQRRPAGPSLPALLLTPAEVAAWLKTTISAVYAKAERGTAPRATRLGRRLFIRAELLAYIEQGRVSQSGGPDGGT